MQLIVSPGGAVCCLYDESLDLGALGTVRITRASQVEPDADGQWRADLALVGGPLLGPFVRRSQALVAEREWLLEHWLCSARR